MAYAPQAVFQPGITQAGAAQLGQGLENFAGDMGRLAKQKKAADALYQAVQPDAGDDGTQAANPIMPKAKWDLMGAQDKVAAMGAYVKNTALQSAMAEQQFRQAEAQKAMAQAQAEGGDARLLQALDQQVNSAPTDSLTGEPMTNDPQTVAVASALTPIQRAVIHAGAGMGPNQKGSAAAIYRALLPQIMGQGNEGDPKFTTDTSVPGYTLTGLKGSKQWQALPTGSPKVTMVDDGNGGQVPILQGPKGTVTQIKPGEGAVTSQDQFKELSALHREYVKNAGLATTMNNSDAAKMWQAQADETAQKMTDLSKPRQPAGGQGAAAKTDSTVTTKAQFDALPSGTVYTGKDGKQYRKP